MYILNTCSLLYTNYTSIKLLNKQDSQRGAVYIHNFDSKISWTPYNKLANIYTRHMLFNVYYYTEHYSLQSRTLCLLTLCFIFFSLLTRNTIFHKTILLCDKILQHLFVFHLFPSVSITEYVTVLACINTKYLATVLIKGTEKNIFKDLLCTYISTRYFHFF